MDRKPFEERKDFEANQKDLEGDENPIMMKIEIDSLVAGIKTSSSLSRARFEDLYMGCFRNSMGPV